MAAFDVHDYGGAPPSHPIIVTQVDNDDGNYLHVQLCSWNTTNGGWQDYQHSHRF